MAKPGRPRKKLNPERVQEILTDTRDKLWPKLPELFDKLMDQGIGGDVRAALAVKDLLFLDERLRSGLDPVREAIEKMRRERADEILNDDQPPTDANLDEGAGEAGTIEPDSVGEDLPLE